MSDILLHGLDFLIYKNISDEHPAKKQTGHVDIIFSSS